MLLWLCTSLYRHSIQMEEELLLNGSIPNLALNPFDMSNLLLFFVLLNLEAYIWSNGKQNVL